MNDFLIAELAREHMNRLVRQAELARLVRASEDDVIDGCGIDGGSIDGGTDRQSREIVGADRRQCTSRATDGRTGRRHDERLSHATGTDVS